MVEPDGHAIGYMHAETELKASRFKILFVVFGVALAFYCVIFGGMNKTILYSFNIIVVALLCLFCVNVLFNLLAG